MKTTCPYCGVGCGVDADAAGNVRGDTAHPANRGRLCSKGAALGKTLGDAGRLTTPRVDGRAVGWDGALDRVADTFAATIAAHGPDSVAFYVSGQLLTEDYYVANKLMKGFLGSANIDTNSRLCMASTVAGHVRAFGEDVVPGTYDDLELADLVVLVGSNLAWCHPVLHQRLQASRGSHDTRIVVIDPRDTATTEGADLHLSLASGSDVALFNGLLAYLADTGAVDRDWVARHVNGFDDALAAARRDAPDIDTVAACCGIDPEALETFYTWFAQTPRVVTVFSQGVNQAEDGTDRVNAIINCHLATGRIGRAGAGPFSVTGQPNAMGGREVGGLANQLAAHMSFANADDVDRVRAFWQAPAMATKPGLKAVEMFDAVRDGRIKAIWIAATNPAASMPRAGVVADALRACPFVVVSDCWDTDTSALADVVLPASAWGEKDGTVTNSERCISRQRPFRAAPGSARPDWWMFTEVARRMGFADAFDYDGPGAIFREHALLSGVGNDGRRVFDITMLADTDYDAMKPVQWPLDRDRLFADGGFSTPDLRARCVAVRSRAEPVAHGHFVLNTGRIRDQWHTMTRTGRVASLATHTPEPTLAINPTDAARLGLAAGALARVATADGSVVLRVEPTHAQRRGEVFAPMHWSRAFAGGEPVTAAVGAACDPHSGQPALKSTVARLSPVAEHWHGLLVRRADGPVPVGALWVRIPSERGQLFRVSGLAPLPPEPDALIGAWLAAPDCERIEVADPRRGVLRVAALRDGALESCVLIAPTRDRLPSPAAFLALLGEAVAPAARARLLAGVAGGAPDEGRMLCSCFGVSEAAVRHACVSQRLMTTGEIGAALRAGTNCGSCVPELAKVLRDVREPAV